VQSTSDLGYFHARDLPCSRVKSHYDPIIDCRVDSAVLNSFIYAGISWCLIVTSIPRVHAASWERWMRESTMWRRNDEISDDRGACQS